MCACIKDVGEGRGSGEGGNVGGMSGKGVAACATAAIRERCRRKRDVGWTGTWKGEEGETACNRWGRKGGYEGVKM